MSNKPHSDDFNSASNEGNEKHTNRHRKSGAGRRRARSEQGTMGQHVLRTSPLKRSKSRCKAPSTVSTAHSDAFNAPIPDDEDLSYVELFRKYKSHVSAREHLNKIEHARNERAARNFESNRQDYSTVQNLRVTARFAKAHGEMSKDEGGFRVPMQPRVSPVKRFQAMSMGTKVLPPGEGFSVVSDEFEEQSFDNKSQGIDPAKKQRDRRRKERQQRRKKRTESPTVDNIKKHQHQRMVVVVEEEKDRLRNRENVEEGVDDEGDEEAGIKRVPFVDESLEAYNFHLQRHGERRSKRRIDRDERKLSRSSTSLAREWKRTRKKEKETKRANEREQRKQRALARGIHPGDIPEMYDDGKEDPEDWLTYNRPLQMNVSERIYLHKSFDPSNTKIVVEVSSKRLSTLSSDLGKSTLQLQLGASVIRSLVYSANHFHNQELPVDAILAMTFNQEQRSAKTMRRAWRTRKTTSGKLEKFCMAQSGLTSIPENLGMLSGLLYLDLHSNRLTEIPDDLILLKHLKVLHLHANRLEKLPANFGQLKNLEELDVSQNLIAYMPDGIHKCTKLRHVRYNANRVMVMGVFPVPRLEDTTVKSFKEDDVWEKVDGLWWGCVFKNTRTGTLKRKPPTNAIVVDKVLNMREAKTWGGDLFDLKGTKKKRDKSLNFSKLRQQGAPMSMLRLALRNSNSSEWEVGVDVNGDTYYETCLKDPGEYGMFLNRQYNMPREMDRIGSMHSLQSLQLSLNGVRTIPPSIGTGRLQACLKELHLEFNKIRDLPDTLCRLRALELLYLGNNLIEELPAQLGNCVKLRVIRLQFNKVKVLPSSIGKCRELETLWLNNNLLKDLPPRLGNCSKLNDIKAKNNHEDLNKRFVWNEGTASILYEMRRRLSLELTGPPPSVELVGIGVNQEVLIPKQRFLNMIEEKCEAIRIAAEAEGKIDLRARKRLQEKKLKEKNRHRKKGEEAMFEEAEDEFKHLTINFNWMNLTEIPAPVLKLEKKLRILRMVGNNMIHMKPEHLAPLGGLVQLNLNASNIQQLPDVFGKMRFLQELHLAENKLEQIPHSIMRLKNLTVLDVAHNRLLSISSAVGRLRSVTEMNFAANSLEEIPKELGEAQTLRKIDFSSNSIRSIPEECGNLFRLRKLNLNFNKLTSIPESFAQLSSLKILLLCRNRIKSLPRSLAASVDVAAEYEKLADQNASAKGKNKKGSRKGATKKNKSKGDKKNPNSSSSSNSNSKQEELDLTGGSSAFAEKFVKEQYEDWKAWAKRQEELEKLAEENDEEEDEEEDEGGSSSGKKKKKTKKKSKKKNAQKPSKSDLSSPYMLLTGIVSGAVEEGTHIIQQQTLWDPTVIAAATSGTSADDESDGEGVSRRHQYARGIVCEILSSSSIIVRLTTLGRKNVPSILFVPGSMLLTNGINGDGKGEDGIKIGVPKTATQHRHVILTFETGADELDDHAVDDDIGGVAGQFMLRLDRSAWLQQKDTGACGKVLSAICLKNLPDVPEMFEAFESMATSGGDASATDNSEGEKTEDETPKESKTKEQGVTADESMMATQGDLELDDDERVLENTSLVTVVLLLLSRNGVNFNTEGFLNIYSNVPLPPIDEEESVDGEAAALRHLMKPPMHVTRRVHEMMVVAPFQSEDEDIDVMERGRVLLQSSALEYAPPSVSILTILPQKGKERDNAPPENDVAIRGVNKEHREKLRQETIEQKEQESRLRRLPLLVVTGRPVRHRKIYVCDEERPMIKNIGESIGGPLEVVKQRVRLDPSRWARLAGRVGTLAALAGRSMKRGALKLLEKAVGAEKANEYEERAVKVAEQTQARALMLRQAAIERSIAMRRGMAASALMMAKASRDMRKNMRNRLIETVTGKYQLDDISEDSDTPKQLLQLENGDSTGEVKVYRQDMRGLLVGGIKLLSKQEIHSLMKKELEDYAQVLQEQKEQEEKDQRLGKSKKKKKKNGKNRRKGGGRGVAEMATASPAPLISKPSPLANTLVVLRLSANRLTEVPETFSYFNVLKFMSIDQNPILSPPSLLANMGIDHIRAYFALRSQRLTQLKIEMKHRKLQFHEDRISPKAEAILAKESRGHLTKHDLRAFDAQIDKLVNGQIVLFRYTAKKIVKNLVRVAAKRQHWYHQKILCDFLQLLEVVELESLAVRCCYCYCCCCCCCCMVALTSFWYCSFIFCSITLPLLLHVLLLLFIVFQWICIIG
jgi:Leucine-rich repeat (LRR) protein